MTGCASEDCQGSFQTVQARPLRGIVGHIPLLFAILEGIKFRGITARVDEDAILIDHGSDLDRLIGRKVLASEARLRQLGENGTGHDGPTGAPSTGEAATGKWVDGARDEQFAQRLGQIPKRDGSCDASAAEARHRVVADHLGAERRDENEGNMSLLVVEA